MVPEHRQNGRRSSKRACTTPIVTGTAKCEPLKMTTPLPEHVWEEISVEFAEPFPTGEYLLIMMDEYSRFPEVEILYSKSAKAVIPKLHQIFARPYCPEK
ncbi:transposon Ty3-G Gag-Pol polyprotein [Elysia marginata]|uniref:Transposon Ty3-G Gag-Pol polyprotein n=1 Tax=Elysia marginata TaxID=1093978 RepID=A0AAV4HVB8_9GAST|nr:transposon Ty3-G Gag-Pol polyprotein [Elysia marginata]